MKKESEKTRSLVPWKMLAKSRNIFFDFDWQNQSDEVLLNHRETDKETKMNDVLFYFADKLLDFELAILLIVIGYYINKWLDGKK